MTRDAAREQRWLWRGIITLVVLALALFGLTTYSVVQTSKDRAAASERADRTARELHVLAESLDYQAGQLDRQAAALERQAAQLEQQASRAEASREQFREAARTILGRLGATVDAFDPMADVDVSSSTVERRPQTAPTRTVEPEPEPEPDPDSTRPECQAGGTGPPRCHDGT